MPQALLSGVLALAATGQQSAHQRDGGIEGLERRQKTANGALGVKSHQDGRYEISNGASGHGDGDGFSQNQPQDRAPRKPESVLRTPTSRMRSRTDMAMVLAETSSMVNTTAPCAFSHLHVAE